MSKLSSNLSKGSLCSQQFPRERHQFDTFSRTGYGLRGAFNTFPEFFIQAFKIIVDSWKFSMLLLYILWDDRPIFMISGTNEQLLQELEYTLLKPDCNRPIFQTLVPVTFVYSLSSEAVVMRELRRWKRLWHTHTRGLPWGLAEVVWTVQQVHCSWRRLLRRGLKFHVCTINKSAHTKKVDWVLHHHMKA